MQRPLLSRDDPGAHMRQIEVLVTRQLWQVRWLHLRQFPLMSGPE